MRGEHTPAGGGNVGISIVGAVTFPAPVQKVPAKELAATAGPILTITDLNGNVLATPVLTAVAGSATQYTYSIDLPAGKDYILKATWGGQVLNDFAFCLFVGFISGVYSTVYIASPLIISWHGKSGAKR